MWILSSVVNEYFFCRYWGMLLFLAVLAVLLSAIYLRYKKYKRQYNDLCESSAALRDHLSELEELCLSMAELGKISYFVGSAEQQSLTPDAMSHCLDDYCGININKIHLDDRERYFNNCRDLFTGKIKHFKESCQIQTDNGHRRFLIAAKSFILPDSGHRKFLFASMDISKLEQQTLELADADSILDGIFDNLPGHIFIKNISDNFSYVRCSPSYSQLVQKNPAELTGKNDFDIFEYSLAQSIRASDMHIASSGNTADHRWFFTTPDGKEHAIRFIARPLKRMDGSEWLLGFGVDVTQQEHIAVKLRRRNKELRLLLSQHDTAEILLDEHLNMVCSTPGLQQILTARRTVDTQLPLNCQEVCQCGISDPANCPAAQALKSGQIQYCRLHSIPGKILHLKPLISDIGSTSYVAVRLDDVEEEEKMLDIRKDDDQ